MPSATEFLDEAPAKQSAESFLDEPPAKKSAVAFLDEPPIPRGTSDTKPLFDDPPATPVDKGLLLTLGKVLDFGKTALNEIAPGFVEQATTSPLPATHYKPDPTDTLAASAGKAALNTFTGVVESVTSPAMVTTLAAGGISPAIGKVIAGGFGAEMASAIPGQVEEAITAPTTQEKIEGGLGAILSGLFATGAAIHIKGGLREKLAPILGEEVKTPVEPIVPEPVRPQEAPKTEIPPITPDETISSPERAGRNGEVPPAGEVLGESPGEVLPVVEPKLVEEPVRPAVDEKAAEPIKFSYVTKEGRDSTLEAKPEEAVEALKSIRESGGEIDAINGKVVGAQSAEELIQEKLSPSAVEDSTANAASKEAAQADIPEIMSPGPGAASAKEPLASYEQRRFGKRFQADEKIDPAIREQTGNQYYEPISNKVTVAEAEGLIENYGTDTSIRLVRDDAAPMPPRVRVTMGQALIKKLNQSHQEAKLAGDPRATEFLNQAVDTAEYLSELGTTLGQGTQAFAIWDRLTPEGMLLEATRIAKKSDVKLTPEQIEKVTKLTAEIEGAPEGFQKGEKTMELMNFMAEIKGANPADIPTALWYSNILSGYSTQLVNTIDTAINVFAESAAMATSHPSATPQIVSGLYQGLIRGGFEAASVLKTGKSLSGDKIGQQRILERVQFGKKGGVPLNTDTVLGRFMKSAFESKSATVLNLWKYPLRAMVASDTVFFNSMKEARARFLARGLAKKEGLSGTALFERVDQVLNEGPGRVDAAIKQAQEEGLSGLRERRRVSEIIEQGRPEELVDNAREAAEIATYNHEPSGVLGLVAHNIANITEGFPPAKAIVPFTRIVANVANRGLNYTPWGYKRLFFGEWGGKHFGTEPPTGEAFRSQLVKATLGTTAMTTVALLDSAGTIQVTAQGPEDANERKQLQNTGWKPYSVKIGDTFYSYQYTPFNLGFAMIGHYRDAVRYNKLNEKDAGTRLAYGMMKAFSTISDMSFLSGVSDFIETMQGATSSTKGAGRLFARTASSVVVPNLVKQIDKLFDPTVYQADSITEGLIRETPIARGAMLKPMLNVLGEPVKPSQNRFFTSDSKGPVWSLIVEKQAWVPVPSKTTKIGNRPIKPDEYYELISKSGPLIRRYIQSNLSRFKTMDGEKVQDAIRKESEKIRTSVKKRFR